ncbi:MAG: hypothetical protein AAF827_18415, partial [Cyanobacteria bacterium P01_D01_bin.6]
RFTRVDLPTLGRPIIATMGSGMDSGSGVMKRFSYSSDTLFTCIPFTIFDNIRGATVWAVSGGQHEKAMDITNTRKLAD